MQFLSSISSLASQFDAFILDLWGVIHDGQELYPQAKECLEHLKGEGKKIVLLSNAPRRASTAAEALTRMGVKRDFYDALITSGEAAYICLADKSSPVFQPSGNRYVYIGLERDRSLLDGLPFSETDDPAAAHFLILSHTFYDNQPEAELAPLLERCLAAKLPALCVNPDMEVVRQNGEHVYCAGVIAADYATKGGQVIYFGKPHPVVYGLSFKALTVTPKSRIVAVGDNLATDILGANRMGIKSALITGGILSRELGAAGTDGYAERLHNLLANAPAGPDYIFPSFNW